MAKEEKAKNVGHPGWNFLQNPLAFGLKRHFYEILQEKYIPNEQIIEWMAANTLTENQYEEIGKLVSNLYEAGYMKAVEDHKAQLESMGVRAYVRPQTPDSIASPIFPQEEKSG